MPSDEMVQAEPQLIDLFVRTHHINDVTPEKSNPSKPPDPRAPNPYPYGSWEWMKEDEERSLDRMIEAMRRDTAKRRAVLNIKLRLLAEAGIMIKLTWREHFLV